MRIAFIASTSTAETPTLTVLLPCSSCRRSTYLAWIRDRERYVCPPLFRRIDSSILLLCFHALKTAIPRVWEAYERWWADNIGRSREIAVPCPMEARVHHGNHSDRIAEVGYREKPSLQKMCADCAWLRYMALPQHKKLPQPAEGSTF